MRGNGPLSGTVVVPGAKNSVLKLMATTILCDGPHELTNVPDIVDVAIMGDLLAAIGVEMVRPEPGTLLLTNTGHITPVAPYELVERIRASINVLGPLLTRCGEVKLSMPGGDDFGSRPIDIRQSRDQVVSAVKRALDDAGIEIPFPYRTMTFKEPLRTIPADTPE